MKQYETLTVYDNLFSQRPTERQLLSHMRQNMKELNRSMQSIQKMIERSRSLLKNSRENSISHRDSLQKKVHEKRQNINPKNITHLDVKELRQEMGKLKLSQMNKVQTQMNDLKSYRSTNRQTLNKTLAPSVKTSHHAFNNPKNSPRGKYDVKFNSTLRKEAQLKKSVQDGRKIMNNFNQTAFIRQRLKSTSKERNDTQKQIKLSPFKEIEEQGMKIYKFSPQKTNKCQQTNSQRVKLKIVSMNTEQLNKIKLKTSYSQQNVQDYKPATPMKMDRSIINKDSTSSNDIMRIQDDNQEQELKTTEKKQYQYSDSKHRYKTEYKQDQMKDFQYQFKLQEPTVRTSYKNPTKKKINLKSFQKQYSKREIINSERDQKNNQVEAPRITQRNNLVKQLEQLETISASQQQRRKKFMLKIKKYGFVQKYLTETQIWSIYEQLAQSNISELKWPIHIVDEVYKKMKVIK